MVNESLDSIILAEKPTLKQELIERIKHNPSSWRDYFKTIAPGSLIGISGSTLTQLITTSQGHTDAATNMFGAFIGSVVPSYIGVFATEYIRNKNIYKSVFSKEYLKFFYTYMAADYVTILTTYSPVLLALTSWLTNNTELGPLTRAPLAGAAASLSYITVMAGLHPITKRINNTINAGIKFGYNKLTKTFTKETRKIPDVNP